MTAEVFVDAAHLLAACGRGAGLGSARMRGRFDVTVLLEQVIGLVPQPERPILVRWYDATAPSGPRPAAPELDSVELHVTLLPLKGGKQQAVDVAIMRDLLLTHLRTPGTMLYLLGDPRRHALALQHLRENGAEVTLIGVADGEVCPGRRIWLRRPEVLRALRDRRPRPLTGNVVRTYQRPTVQTVHGETATRVAARRGG